jgi:hypothetical protein
MVQREREQRLAAAHAQVAYDAEVAALKLAKLQAYFDSTLAEHVVSVQPFAAAAAAAAAAIGGGGGRSRSVSTFRPPELPREVVVSTCNWGACGPGRGGFCARLLLPCYCTSRPIAVGANLGGAGGCRSAEPLRLISSVL